MINCVIPEILRTVVFIKIVKQNNSYQGGEIHVFSLYVLLF